MDDRCLINTIKLPRAGCTSDAKDRQLQKSEVKQRVRDLCRDEGRRRRSISREERQRKDKESQEARRWF